MIKKSVSGSVGSQTFHAVIKFELMKLWTYFSMAVISLVFWKLKSISQMTVLQGKQRLKNAISRHSNYTNSSSK